MTPVELLERIRKTALASQAAGDMQLAMDRHSPYGATQAWWAYLGAVREDGVLGLLNHVDQLQARHDALYEAAKAVADAAERILQEFTQDGVVTGGPPVMLALAVKVANAATLAVEEAAKQSS